MFAMTICCRYGCQVDAAIVARTHGPSSDVSAAAACAAVPAEAGAAVRPAAGAAVCPAAGAAVRAEAGAAAFGCFARQSFTALSTALGAGRVVCVSSAVLLPWLLWLQAPSPRVPSTATDPTIRSLRIMTITSMTCVERQDQLPSLPCAYVDAGPSGQPDGQNRKHRRRGWRFHAPMKRR